MDERGIVKAVLEVTIHMIMFVVQITALHVLFHEQIALDVLQHGVTTVKKGSTDICARKSAATTVSRVKDVLVQHVSQGITV